MTALAPKRRLRPRLFALGGALITLVAVVAAPACRSTSEVAVLEQRIEAVVDDAERRAELLAIVAERRRARALFADQRINLEQRLRASNSDPYASPAQLRAVVDAFDRDYAAYRGALLDAAVRMRAITTPAEWSALAEADLAAILDHEIHPGGV